MRSRGNRQSGAARNNQEGIPERPQAHLPLWLLIVVVTVACSIIPLVIITVASYGQYADVTKEELRRDIRQLTYNTKASFEYFIQQSEAGLRPAGLHFTEPLLRALKQSGLGYRQSPCMSV